MARSAGDASRLASRAIAEHVGVAEFRGKLAKYLKTARSGRPVVVQERGRDAYVLVRIESDERTGAFGCMRDRTEYSPGAVVNADARAWSPGRLP